MKIIQGSAGTGKTTELVKRFMQDNEESILIVVEESLESIEDRIQYLITQGIEFLEQEVKGTVKDTVDTLELNLKHMLDGNQVKSVYIDAPVMNTEEVIDYYKELEEEHNVIITITQQIKRQEGVKGVTIVE